MASRPRQPGKVRLSKPTSIWQKPIKVDVAKLLSVLGKGAIDVTAELTANPLGTLSAWKAFAKAGIDAIGTLTLQSTPEERAWLLVHRSLLAAMADLASDIAAVDLKESSRSAESLNALVSGTLEAEAGALGSEFFSAPASVSAVAAIEEPFAAWLVWYGLSKVAGAAVARRLGGYFTVALHEEWRTHPNEYEPLRLALDSPLADSAGWELAWRRQMAWLHRATRERVFGEAFSLDDVYVPLRAYYESGVQRAQAQLRFEASETASNEHQRVVVDLGSELNEWATGRHRDDAVRVISGGPGAGKSAFTKMFAASRAAEGDRVIRIPLHALNVTIDLDAAVAQFVEGAGVLVGNPLEQPFDGKQLLLILDGLDELEKQGSAAEMVARDFCDHVLRRVETLNQSQLRIQVLFSGRDIAVQAVARVFRKERAILHLLPYYLTKSARDAHPKFVDGKKLLHSDQRDIWWRRYGAATGQPLKKMPAELGTSDLDEITAQPLLCYLVALSYAQKKIDFQQGVTLKAIYDDLLGAVYLRAYDRGRPHAGARVLEDSEFARIMEEIALAAWHGDGRTTTVREIEAHCEASGLLPLLDRVKQGAASGVTRLLMAFYARGHGTRDGHETFELTHKSFGEYLTSRRVVSTIARMVRERRRQRECHEGWSEREALYQWIGICGPTAMDQHIMRFVREEILQLETATVHEWQEELASLFNLVVDSGMPAERRMSAMGTFQEASRQSRNAEEALLACWNACARAARQHSYLGGQTTISFGTWFRHTQLQRNGSENVLALDCLSWADLSACTLDGVDFIYADLSDARFKNASLWFATMYGAKLHRTDFEGARLNFAIFARAELSDTSFRGCQMESVTFGPDLGPRIKAETTDFSGASLEFAEISNVEGVQLTDEQWADVRRSRRDELVGDQNPTRKARQ